VTEHTNDDVCPMCPGRHGTAAQCDHSAYSRRQLRFLRAHREAYETAYLSPDPKSSSNELERLERERKNLPRGHYCTCDPLHCAMCQRLACQRPNGPDVGVEIGRTSLVNAPTPMVIMLDVEAGYAA
jgi:hypothetical protein